MSRIALAQIRTLTFYKDSYTDARRTDPIPQLTCIGRACELYRPDVVRCVNVGGDGTEVDWKCEADLPEALRFGRVEVSCEGWSAPGDSYVLKGSCALSYRLVDIPDNLRSQHEQQHYSPSGRRHWFGNQDSVTLIFMITWMCALLLILYAFLKSCWRGPSNSGSPPRRPGTAGYFSGYDHPHDDTRPPPPYSKYPSSSTPTTQDANWSPGFWTGAALGGLGTYLFSNNRPRNPRRTTVAYDWEQNLAQRPSRFHAGDGEPGESRGEGSSTRMNLGSTRRSTGLGGSTVR